MRDYFTISDNHFGHSNIIKLCNRPFKDCEEMDNFMIEKWNSVVKPGDKVFYCGDFGFCTQERFDTLMRCLNGRKILVQGNHDNRSWRFYLDGDRFDLVCKYFSFKGILFTHRPADYFSMCEEKINVHGHIHNLGKISGYDTTDQKRINVSVEAVNYTPVSLEEILDMKEA
jgi:calcineurin-like phosphoesterase family protein